MKDLSEIKDYEQVLDIAHGKGIQSIATDIIISDQVRSIVKAVIVMNDGTVWSGLGDADKENTEPPFDKHLLRVAETRAKARAMRDAINDGKPVSDELHQNIATTETGEKILVDTNKSKEDSEKIVIGAIKHTERKSKEPIEYNGHNEEAEESIASLSQGKWTEGKLKVLEGDQLDALLGEFNVEFCKELPGSNTKRKKRDLILNAQNGSLEAYIRIAYGEEFLSLI